MASSEDTCEVYGRPFSASWFVQREYVRWIVRYKAQLKGTHVFYKYYIHLCDSCKDHSTQDELLRNQAVIRVIEKSRRVSRFRSMSKEFFEQPKECCDICNSPCYGRYGIHC